MEGRLHIYHQKRNLLLFEYASRYSISPSGDEAVRLPPNILLFIGGMYDNFCNTAYVTDLAALFPRHKNQQWAVIHAQLSSAMRQFGFSDLNRDVEEIATAITFIRQQLRNNEPTNIVLMGHSTGCQDTLHYLHSPIPSIVSPATSSLSSGNSKPNEPTQSELRPVVQGAILQAAVSDRDLIVHMINTDPEIRSIYEKCIDMISKVSEDEHHKTILPLHWTTPLYGPAPLSITRFLSLLSPESPENPRDDDKFSHDLPPEALAKTFGAISTNRILQLAMGKVEKEGGGGEVATSVVSNSCSEAEGNKFSASTPGEQEQPPKSEAEAEAKSKSKQVSILILLSDSDKYYPPTLSNNKNEFLTKWKTAIEQDVSSSLLSINNDNNNKENKSTIHLHPLSHVIPNAQHDLAGETKPERIARLVDMRYAVLKYLSDMVGGVDEVAWRIWQEEKENENKNKKTGHRDDDDNSNNNKIDDRAVEEKLGNVKL